MQNLAAARICTTQTREDAITLAKFNSVPWSTVQLTVSALQRAGLTLADVADRSGVDQGRPVDAGSRNGFIPGNPTMNTLARR